MPFFSGLQTVLSSEELITVDRNSGDCTTVWLQSTLANIVNIHHQQAVSEQLRDKSQPALPHTVRHPTILLFHSNNE